MEFYKYSFLHGWCQLKWLFPFHIMFLFFFFCYTSLQLSFQRTNFWIYYLNIGDVCFWIHYIELKEFIIYSAATLWIIYWETFEQENKKIYWQYCAKFILPRGLMPPARILQFEHNTQIMIITPTLLWTVFVFLIKIYR